MFIHKKHNLQPYNKKYKSVEIKLNNGLKFSIKNDRISGIVRTIFTWIRVND
jgi:hypothetical protein